MGKKRLLTQERRREVVRLLESDGRVVVADLVRRFGVSAVTVRGDLKELARAGVLVRSHGGAVRPESGAPDYPIALKASRRRREKAAIAKQAVKLIEPRQTVILDSGTTTAALTLEIKARRLPLTVITNALNLANELALSAEITLIFLGGVLRPMSSSMVGPQAERALRGLTADHVFLGVDGLDLKDGLCTPDLLEARLNQIMMDVSRQATALADSSKLGRRSLAVIAPVEKLDRLITDRQADPAMIAEIRARDVDVILA